MMASRVLHMVALAGACWLLAEPVLASGSSHAPARKAAVRAPAYTGPGQVTVLPITALPRGAILPPARSIPRAAATAVTGEAQPAGKVPAVAKKPGNDFYIVNNPELRWQFYSYP